MEIAKQGNIAAVFTTLDNNPTATAGQQHVCGTLKNQATNNDSEVEITRQGDIPAILKAPDIRQPPHSHRHAGAGRHGAEQPHCQRR